MCPAESLRGHGSNMNRILKNYFYWTYPRGSFHYDVMVTLILAFIFVTPHLWNYGDAPTSPKHLQHPLQMIGDNGRGFVVTVAASDVSTVTHLELNSTESYSTVRNKLRKAIEPVTGDAVFVDRWITIVDEKGTLSWKVWAHR